MATGQHVVAVRQPIWIFRGVLLGASLPGLGFALLALVAYPAPPAQVALYWAAVILLGACAALAWLSVRMAALQATTIRRSSVRFGLLGGGCWIVEMVTANLVPLPTGPGCVYRRRFAVGRPQPLAHHRAGVGNRVGHGGALLGRALRGRNTGPSKEEPATSA